MITVSRTMCLSAVLVALSLAVAAGQDQTSKAASKDQKAASQAAILRGRVTDLAGAPLAGARVRVVIPAADMRFVDASTPDRRLETQSDAQGDYRIELTGIAKRTKVSIDAMKPGYRDTEDTHIVYRRTCRRTHRRGHAGTRTEDTHM